GANTVGLRGLASSRTLVLLNGRRLAPAGVGPQLIAADLNTLPTSVVQRIEVLREGASSIYGSDAIAGVINVITDTTLDGLTLDAYADIPEIGAGKTLRGSIAWGKTFDRGHIMASFEARDDAGLRLGDRKDTRCPRELAFVNGQEIGQMTPDNTSIRCFPFQRGGGGLAAGYGVSAFFPGAGRGIRSTFAGYDTGNPDIFAPPAEVRLGTTPNDQHGLPESPSTVLDTTVFSPIRTYTAYVNGAYELDALGDAELYGEALFVRRKSHQDNVDRPDFTRVENQWQNYECPTGAGTCVQTFGPSINFPGYEDLEALGYPVSPFFPVSWANAGMFYFQPFFSPNRLVKTKQKVDFWRANAGLRGNLGVGDWRYDGNIQISRTKGRDDRQTPITERVGNMGVAVLAPAGTPAEFTTTALPGQLHAGNVYTCLSNVTDGAYNGGQCQPINAFDPQVLLYGKLTDQQFDYLYPWLNYSKTTYNQETFALSFDGSLFPLQGGDVKAAVGFEHRRDHINDRPGPERQANQMYYYGIASQTKGSDKVTEAYAEINAPILKDLPMANLLEVDASGRWTHYKSYGSEFTYHIGAQYAPVKEIRFRGNYGTNFRAPNLYEQFVAEEIGFYGNDLDPCANFAGTSSPGTPIYENCLTELTAVLGSEAAALAFNPPGGSFEVSTTGGKGVVEAETAKTWGFGGVFTLPRSIADLSLAVDYWHIKVDGEVATLGNLILNFCYDSDDYPNNPYCALIVGRNTFADVGDPQQAGTITQLQNPYLNIAQQISAGIDFDARYATRLFGGKFSTQLQATRMLTQKIEFFPGDGLNNYNGTLGYPGFGAGPKWTGALDTRFTTANDITFRWGVEYIGPQTSEPGALFLDEGQNPCLEGSEGCNPVEFDLHAPSHFEHGVSVQWLWRNIGQVTVGVNNLFDKDPPVISDDNVSGFPRFGNFFANGGYDYRGRSFFINVTRSFK
ncbi:MAG TPA: TonB-dependent receptor, partial [Sphingomicrobium sp.]|nr:TonB-dependent receptor [Sphingomicrobium sp.]